jgi:hypothetical protein
MYGCEEVPLDLTVSKAHRLLQLHRDCHYRCPTRRAAVDLLADEGRYVLSSRFG